MTEELAKRVGSVTTTDLSPLMVKRAKSRLKKFSNIKYKVGKIFDLKTKEKFDLVFESRILLHILNAKELQKTADCMKKMSDKIFLCEHIIDKNNRTDQSKISRFTILRTISEYKRLFCPYILKKKKVTTVGDKHALLYFEKRF